MYGIGSGRIGRCIAALGLAAMLGGCAVSDRAEELYLRQNRAVNALAVAITQNEIQNPPLAEALYAAEAELDQACGPLRHAGYLRFHAEEISSELEWEILNSLDDCTLKTQELEKLLWRLNPDIAIYFLPAPVADSKHFPSLSFSPR